MTPASWGPPSFKSLLRVFRLLPVPKGSSRGRRFTSGDVSATKWKTFVSPQQSPQQSPRQRNRANEERQKEYIENVKDNVHLDGTSWHTRCSTTTFKKDPNTGSKSIPFTEPSTFAYRRVVTQALWHRRCDTGQFKDKSKRLTKKVIRMIFKSEKRDVTHRSANPVSSATSMTAADISKAYARAWRSAR